MAFRGRGPRFVPPPPDAHRINRHIRVPQVRLVGADGSQLGIVPIEDALRRAEEAQLDLVEVAPAAQDQLTCRSKDMKTRITLTGLLLASWVQAGGAELRPMTI